MTTEQRMLLYTMAHGYCMIAKEDTPEEHRSDVFYRHVLEVNKFFRNKKTLSVPNIMKKRLDAKKKELIELDNKFFEKKNYSAYIVMLYFIRHLVQEVNDIEARNRFGHYKFEDMTSEIFVMMPEIEADTNKFVRLVIDAIEKF